MEQTTENSPPPNGSEEEPITGQTRPRRMPLSNLQIILIALLIVGGRLVIDFGQRIVEGQQKVAEQQALEAEIEALLQEKQDLETAKAYYSSPAFVESWAHDQGKMVREGETLIIPIYDEQDQQTRNNTPVVTTEQEPPLPPWHVWWALFFDTPPLFSQQ